MEEDQRSRGVDASADRFEKSSTWAKSQLAYLSKTSEAYLVHHFGATLQGFTKAVDTQEQLPVDQY